MRIRWGRVVTAWVTMGVGVPGIAFGSLWITRPSPQPVERSFPGIDDCVTSTVLESGASLHRKHDEPDDTDRLSVDVVLAAAGCRQIDEVDLDLGFPVFKVADHGLSWIETHESGDAALKDALAIWELAADQRRVGPLVNVGIWSAVAGHASKIVERELDGTRVSAGERFLAQRRLTALGNAPLDWHEVDAREERSTWALVWRAAGDPVSWLHVPEGWWMLYQARTGTQRFVDDLRVDVHDDHQKAATLAGF